MPLCVQAQKQPVALPEVAFIKPAKDHYIWEKAGQIKGRVKVGNSVAVGDSVVYSFGGIDTIRGQWAGWQPFTRDDRHLAQGELSFWSDGKLERDSIHYPGKGFYHNLFFYNNGFLYVGGGHDSGASLYAWPDFWRYDLNQHLWSRLRDIPIYYRHRLYVYPNDSGALILAATLKNELFKEATPALLQYNATDDTWSLKSQILKATDLAVTPPEGFISGALEPIPFRIENDLYILLLSTCGFGGDCPNSFFKLSMSDGKWIALPPFPGTIKAHCFAFSDGTYGFVGGGIGAGPFNSRVVYRYDPRREEWSRIEDLPNGLRRAVGWNFRGENYVGFGLTDELDRIVIYKLKEKKKKGKNFSGRTD